MDTRQFSSMDSPLLFVADLHLHPDRPAAIQTFLAFLAGEARQAGALFILGDLFEAWIGDDAAPADDPVAPAIRALVENGTWVGFMPGNRDFLVGDDYIARARIERMREPTVIRVDDLPVVLEHGDALCTDDAAYQAFRQQVRDPAWQRDFLALPPDERYRQALEAREKSGEAMAGKDSAIMDVNQQAVRDRLTACNARDLIHGHTHRPAVHAMSADGNDYRRVVLGDWFQQGSVLRIDQGEWQLASLPFAADGG
jgi:UDP-2,3-diacylglucosamine hydrolase